MKNVNDTEHKKNKIISFTITLNQYELDYRYFECLPVQHSRNATSMTRPYGYVNKKKAT